MTYSSYPQNDSHKKAGVHHRNNKAPQGVNNSSHKGAAYVHKQNNDQSGGRCNCKGPCKCGRRCKCVGRCTCGKRRTIKRGGRASGVGIIGAALSTALVPFGLFAAQKNVQENVPVSTPYKKTYRRKNRRTRKNGRKTRKYRK